jgi:hypothetical protein
MELAPAFLSRENRSSEEKVFRSAALGASRNLSGFCGKTRLIGCAMFCAIV